MGLGMMILDTHIQDRIIIATALQHQAFLMSADGAFGQYQELSVLLILPQ
jgi:PIN domain nuclease of toxin-antitoxin system